MIPAEEIKEVARRWGVPESTVERDYAQGWLLASLSKNIEMALKGGTGMRKAFLEGYRFSDDLDFTLLGDYSVDDVEGRVRDAVIAARRESGIDFEDAITFAEVENGYRGSVYFRILRGAGSPLKIRLDLTLRDNEPVLLPLEMRVIFHPYSDVLGAEVLSYSLEEVFAEKMRALFERTRPRDLYDVWRLSGLELDVSGIVVDKFGFKGVIFDLDDLRVRRGDFGDAWRGSLRHQLSDLPSFDYVFEEVVRSLNRVSGAF